MKKPLLLLAVFFFCYLIPALAIKPQPRILVFSKTTVYHHLAIPAGQKAIQKLGLENNFGVDTTTDASLFTEKNLKRYAAVVFLSTSGNMLDTVQQAEFERYIQAGGGYMGIHGASAGEYDWHWYGKLVGAIFTKHPAQQKAKLIIEDSKNPATKHLPKEWDLMDEWYNYRDIQPDIHVLITVDESSYKGGENGKFHPVSWYRKFDGGRSFYTGLGHRDEEYENPLFLNHILAGIKYAMGTKPLDYSKARSKKVKL
jgi:type 1 glutamine amidotransferase